MGYALAVVTIGGALIGTPVPWYNYAPVSTLLLAVIFMARVAGRRPAIFAAAVAALAFGRELPIESPLTDPVGLFRLLALVVLAGYVILTQEQLSKCADRLRSLSRRLFSVQEDERRHLARELHDEFGQVLVSIGMHLRAARRGAGAEHPSLDNSIQLVQRAAEQLRSLVLELRPSVLDSAGLDAALGWLAEEFGRRTGMSVELSGSIGDLPDPVEIGCFRVVQEALTNVMRHARARRIWIALNRNETVAELVVRDDGIGFSVTTILAGGPYQGKLGLTGMLERAELLGGTLDIDSRPGNGTLIRLRVPAAKPNIPSA